MKFLKKKKNYICKPLLKAYLVYLVAYFFSFIGGKKKLRPVCSLITINFSPDFILSIISLRIWTWAQVHRARLSLGFAVRTWAALFHLKIFIPFDVLKRFRIRWAFRCCNNQILSYHLLFYSFFKEVFLLNDVFFFYYLAASALSWARGIFDLHVGSFSCGMWDPVPWPGIKRAPCIGAQSRSHWPTSEVPCVIF